MSHGRPESAAINSRGYITIRRSELNSQTSRSSVATSSVIRVTYSNLCRIRRVRRDLWCMVTRLELIGQAGPTPEWRPECPYLLFIQLLSWRVLGLHANA